MQLKHSSAVSFTLNRLNKKISANMPGEIYTHCFSFLKPNALNMINWNSKGNKTKTKRNRSLRMIDQLLLFCAHET